jgi:hypothetical protein
MACCPPRRSCGRRSYFNNLIEQDHRAAKQRIAVMLGFKGFAIAAITIAGIELMHRIRKGSLDSTTRDASGAGYFDEDIIRDAHRRLIAIAFGVADCLIQSS